MKNSNAEFVDRNFRMSMEILINYQKGNESIDEFCKNLSMTGLFIETMTIQEKGSIIDINFTLPHNHKDFVLKGEVIWARHPGDSGGVAGMGIRFVNISEEQKEIIYQAIKYYRSI